MPMSSTSRITGTRWSAAALAALACVTSTATLSAQRVTLPLTPAEWTATDSIRFETHLGRPSVYINKGVAMSRTAAFRNGSLEFDMAAAPRSSNMGIAFRAQSAETFEVLFFRPGMSGRVESTQYAPAINGVGAAWQIYHGDGANAKIDIPRETWIHIRLRVAADSAMLYVGDADKPALVIPRLVLGGNGTGFALWAGLGGQGGYYSNISYTVDDTPYTSEAPPLPAGSITTWQLSPAFDAAALAPDTLPNVTKLAWETVHAEWPGLVLVNRYRRSPGIGAPSDVDSLMRRRVAGAKVVFARAQITSDRDQTRLMHFGYSDNVVIFCNGRPLYSGVNPYDFRGMGYFEPRGDAVYVPLHKGNNEIVFAVTDFFGGWAFAARLDR